MSTEDGEKVSYSRRDVLTGRPVIDLANAHQERLDQGVETVGELLAFTTIMTLVVSGTRDQAVRYDIHSESLQSDLPDIEQRVEALAQFGKHSETLLNAQEELYRLWIRAYQKEDVKCSGTGSNRTCTTYTYWAEPSELKRMGLNHQQINGGINQLRPVVSKTKTAQSQLAGAFDLSRGSNTLFYEQETKKLSTSRAEAAMAFAAVGGAYLLYEELVEMLSQTDVGDQYLSSLTFNSREGMKRRTFIKVVAALAGTYFIHRGQQNFITKNQTLLDSIRSRVDQTVVNMNIPAGQNFERYFGISVPALYASLSDQRQVYQAVLDSDYNGRFRLLFSDQQWPEIRQAIQTSLEATQQVMEYLESEFQYDNGAYVVPELLTDTTRSLWASQEIRRYVAVQSMTVDLRHFIDVAVLAAGLAGVAALTETVIIPATDDLRRNR